MRRTHTIAHSAAVLALAALAHGQGLEASAGPDAAPDRTTWLVDAGGAYQFRADLDGGGSVAEWRAVLGALARFDISPEVSVALNLGYQFDQFDFNGDTRLGPDPWRNINTLGLGASFTWRPTPDWRLGIGPVLQLAGEAQADAGDALAGGGLVSVAYRFDDRLTLGATLILTTQIEDDFLVFPVPIVEWRITDDLRLSSSGGPTAILRGGLELSWTFAPTLQLGLGARYEKLRFRLADGAAVPNGVGEQNGVPLWLRLGWRPSAQSEIGIFTGVRLGAELTLDDSGGNELASADLDPALLLGLYGSIRF